MAYKILHDRRIDHDPHLTLKRDPQTGIAWLEDGHTGTSVSVHGNISASGSVTGMKRLGHWGKKDRTVRSHGFIFNIDTFFCNRGELLQAVVADHCQCESCKENPARKKTTPSV